IHPIRGDGSLEALRHRSQTHFTRPLPDRFQRGIRDDTIARSESAVERRIAGYLRREAIDRAQLRRRNEMRIGDSRAFVTLLRSIPEHVEPRTNTERECVGEV